jgi:FMN-dependent NADH-azoreductase
MAVRKKQQRGGIWVNILFVNACVRGKESNTLKLCCAALEELQASYPEAVITEVNLDAERPQPLYPEVLKKRTELRNRGELIDPMFDYAWQFAKADKIVIGAPYWDLSFPALLKIYFELISVVDITFCYSKEGKPYGNCTADKLLYITTAGGPVGEYNLGFDYIKGLCTAFYGIPDVRCYALRGLEMGGEIESMLREGEHELRKMMQNWK